MSPEELRQVRRRLRMTQAAICRALAPGNRPDIRRTPLMGLVREVGVVAHVGWRRLEHRPEPQLTGYATLSVAVCFHGHRLQSHGGCFRSEYSGYRKTEQRAAAKR